MPRRWLRDGILDSEGVNTLDAAAEVFYRRLMSVVDDFGRFDARPAVIRARCYPLQLDKVREADIPRWIAACEKAGLIVLYEIDSKPYLILLKLGEGRAKTSKFPDPPAEIAEKVRKLEGTCAHVSARAPDIAMRHAPPPHASRTADREERRRKVLEKAGGS